MALNSSVSLSQPVDNNVTSDNLPLVKCEDINCYHLHHCHHCHHCHHYYHYCDLLITTRSLGISHSSSVRTDMGVRRPSARILSSVARIFISYLSIILSTIVPFHFCPTLNIMSYVPFDLCLGNVLCTFWSFSCQGHSYFLYCTMYTLPSVLEKEPIWRIAVLVGNKYSALARDL